LAASLPELETERQTHSEKSVTMKRFAAIAAAGGLFGASLHAGQFGTGFAISPKGYLVTCQHVVRGAEHILVHTDRGTQSATVIALDPRNDLAILKVDTWDGRFLGLAPSGEVSYATEVTAAGFPDPTVLGMNPKVTKGIVNAMSGVRDDPRYLQISAPVQPGNSGGPLLSQSGRVVGVIAAGLNTVDRMTHAGYFPQSVNFAIKAELIHPLLKNAGVSLPRFGTRTAGHVQQLTRAIEAIALIENVVPGQPRSHARPMVSFDPPPRLVPRPFSSPTPPGVLAPAFQAPPSRVPAATPWIFPDSQARVLSPQEVGALPPAILSKAHQEIYLRRGFHFTTPEGKTFARRYGAYYRPSTASLEEVQARFNKVEWANLRLISAHEHHLARSEGQGRRGSR